MNFNALTKPELRKTASRTLFAIRRFSPEILTTTGVVGTVAAAVLAAKATLHLEPIIDETNANLKEAKAKAEQLSASEYSSTELKRDTLKVYVHTAGQLGKLYGPAVLLGTVSIGCIIGGHGVLQKRNVAAIAAYKGLENRFNAYRKRVADEFGEDKDRDFTYGVRETIKTNEDGVEETVVDIDPDSLNKDFQWVFDDRNANFKSSPDYNLNYIRAQEDMATRRLRSQGYLFLNDVLEGLGFEKTRTGQLTGWVMDAEGSNYVDFGIIDAQSLSSRTFGVDDQDAVYLHFNVDGIIIDQIPFN